MLVEPQLMETATADAAGIGSAIDQAKATAAAATTNLVAAAEDEVSTATAAFFGSFGQEYQSMLQQATVFHDRFTAALAAAGNAYAHAETQIAGTLGLGGGAATATAGTAMKQAVDPAVNAVLIMSGSGTATPSTAYLNDVFSRYLDGTNPGGLGPFTGMLQAVSTAEAQFSAKDLTLNISVARGITELNNAINLAITPGTNQSVSVLGYSQSALISSLEMPKLLAEGFTNGTGGTPIQAYFTLLGDPANPNGGLLSRFPGLSLPSMGITFGASTLSNDFPTSIYTLEYDGFADYPRYPIDFLADLNAFAGTLFVHPTYPNLTQAVLDTAIQLPQSGAPSMTTYNMIPIQNLPLLDPLRAIPVIGNPLADLLQPDLRYLINWGYGDPNYGWSTGPADIQTPFGFLPPLHDTTALGPLLVSGTQQGINAFVGDLSALAPPSLPSLIPGAGSMAGGALGLPAVPSIPSLTGIISAIETANSNFVGSLTADFSTAYGTLLPTADIATAVAVSLPSYDLNLFLNGVTEAINGNPVQGLMDAFGDPIAADIGVATFGGGMEGLVLLTALYSIATGTPVPGPY